VVGEVVQEMMLGNWLYIILKRKQEKERRFYNILYTKIHLAWVGIYQRGKWGIFVVLELDSILTMVMGTNTYTDEKAHRSKWVRVHTHTHTHTHHINECKWNVKIRSMDYTDINILTDILLQFFKRLTFVKFLQ
jgi:hypothetical protein